jgi:hypothetical protein
MESGKPQSDYGLKPKKRYRSQSLQTQLAMALDDAAKLSKEKARDDAAISRMKLVSARIASLTNLVNRKSSGKLRKLEAANEKLTAEVSRLKQELAAALAVKQAAGRPLTEVEIALQNYERERGGQQQ